MYCPQSLEGYKFLNIVDKNSYGFLWQAVVQTGALSGQQVLVNILDLEICDQKTFENMQKQISKWRCIDHENFNKLLTEFLQDSLFCVVYKHCSYINLSDLIKTNYPKGITDITIIATIIRSIVNALSYLHSLNIIYRDLRCKNILITHDGQVVLNNHLLICRRKLRSKRHKIVGPVNWMAPEVLDNESDGFDEKADIWSLGILIIEMTQSKPPYYEQPILKIINQILESNAPELSENLRSCKPLYEFVNFCLIKDPQQRYSSLQLQNLQIVSKSKSKISLKLIDNFSPSNLEKKSFENIYFSRKLKVNLNMEVLQTEESNLPQITEQKTVFQVGINQQSDFFNNDQLNRNQREEINKINFLFNEEDDFDFEQLLPQRIVQQNDQYTPISLQKNDSNMSVCSLNRHSSKRVLISKGDEELEWNM